MTTAKKTTTKNDTTSKEVKATRATHAEHSNTKNGTAAHTDQLDPTNIHVKGLDVNPAPASQSINGQPVSNQYADNIGLPDPGAVIPANHPTKDNVVDLHEDDKKVEHYDLKRTSYKDAIKDAGFEEGDLVRVVRRPLVEEMHEWGGVWPSELDGTIGRKFIIDSDDGAKGYSIDIGHGHMYRFPVYSLERVVS